LCKLSGSNSAELRSGAMGGKTAEQFNFPAGQITDLAYFLKA
jgi:hypothetical protein